jgi:hypothetical protein
MEWLSNAWEWVSGHADTAVSAVSDFLNTKNRISVDERNALINAKYVDAINKPSLSGYQTQNVRSTAGISGFDDIKEASNNRYASFLYYVKAHLQAKKQLENIIPIALHRKTGLGSRK